MRRIILATCLAGVLASTTGLEAAEYDGPSPRAQPKASKVAPLDTSAGSGYGVSRPTAGRPETRKRPALESLEPDRAYGHGRSGYDGGHGRSGEGEGWLGWRSWSRR